MNADDLDPAVDYIFTIGHSNTAFEALLENLRAYSIEAVADVRSQPASRYTPHFNRSELTWQLQEAGIRYAFMGDTLGGRPAGAEYYDGEGHVRYDLWSASDAFRDGIEDLMKQLRSARIALMCAEEDPARCHRHLLIARVLRRRGIDGRTILHLRRSGVAQPDDALPLQATLDDEWRSPAVVARVQRASTSRR
jgi:uncharacterized protein (DUF488 family)